MFTHTKRISEKYHLSVLAQMILEGIFYVKYECFFHINLAQRVNREIVLFFFCKNDFAIS
jgi:hypothetical protein